MKSLRFGILAVVIAAIVVAFALRGLPGRAQQSQPAVRPARTADGKPNLNGIWQAMNTADWNLVAHAATAGRSDLGALGAAPPGLSVVEGNDIPYLPAAVAQRQQNFERRLTDDPMIKCYMPGVPRAAYAPFPFQIVQTPNSILFAYQFAGASRVVPMKPIKPPPVDQWMGMSSGRWEGDTLVVDVLGLNGKAWLDRSGNYASDSLHVVERYTPISADAMIYEATLEDPKVFSRPWKIRMPLYRHLEDPAQMLEFKCVEFAEELMYRPLLPTSTK
jgi:hypothetical protein